MAKKPELNKPYKFISIEQNRNKGTVFIGTTVEINASLEPGETLYVFERPDGKRRSFKEKHIRALVNYKGEI